ncbi:MAG: periplasmic heavy metal sensor [Desulfobacterales bacterium]|nr:MAG: periplasmic heavy metal sensor [Desulfobacterales bacterium]
MSKKLITVITAIALVGFGTFAYAHWNGGYGHQGWMHGGYGMHQGYYGMHQGYYGNQGYGYRGDLNEDQIKSLEKEQAEFMKSTEMIRQDLYSKQLALESELAKSDPDTANATALQKEISELQAQLDQKRIDHMIKVRKISPEAGRGFAAMGPMMGYGSQYPESCWQ